MQHTTIAISSCLVFAIIGKGDHAAAQACGPSSSTAVQHLASIRTSMADTVDLAATGLVDVPANQVSLIQVDSLCAVARTAFNGITAAWGRQPATQVWVYAAGPDRFVVIDVLDSSRHYTAYVVFDATWQHRGGFSG
jgi:hypothetical protein